jgi:hypothetical protein
MRRLASSGTTDEPRGGSGVPSLTRHGVRMTRSRAIGIRTTPADPSGGPRDSSGGDPQDAVDRPGGVGLRRRQHVGVEVERDPDARVAEPFRDDPRMGSPRRARASRAPWRRSWNRLASPWSSPSRLPGVRIAFASECLQFGLYSRKLVRVPGLQGVLQTASEPVEGLAGRCTSEPEGRLLILPHVRASFLASCLCCRLDRG